MFEATAFARTGMSVRAPLREAYRAILAGVTG